MSWRVPVRIPLLFFGAYGNFNFWDFYVGESRLAVYSLDLVPEGWVQANLRSRGFTKWARSSVTPSSALESPK